MVWENELRILRLDLKATGSILRHWAWLEHIGDLKVHPSVAHFLQQDHIYANKAKPPANATPY